MILNVWCPKCKIEFNVSRIDDEDFSPAECPSCSGKAKVLGQRTLKTIMPYDPQTSKPNGFREMEWTMKHLKKRYYAEDEQKQNIKAHKPNIKEV